MTYSMKKQIADDYLSEIAGGLGWDDLSDINSLHDCDTEEDIKEACNERLEEEGFPEELLLNE
jgi:hypothetical protein